MKKIKQIFISLSLLGLSLTACGAKGAQGETGPQGEQGLPGVNGKDGSSLLTGLGEPSSSLGNNGDSYINLDNWNYYVKENGEWVLKGNIKGSDGNNGQNGQNGVSVVSITKTSSEGNVDTYTITYSNGTTSTFTVTNGQDGEKGETGEAGPAGKDGTSLLNGSGKPSSSLGNNGDSYINLDNCDYYVKENGEWVLKGNIKGSDGNNGKDAVQYIPAIFNDYDGSMLYTFYYEKGSTIVYDGPEPTREGYVQDGEHYVYDFIGWDKSLENIQVPTIFTAQYNLRNVTEEYNISIGKIPNLSEDGKTMTYGLYPQNNVNDDASLVEELDKIDSPESNGFYLYKDEYYAKTVATPYGSAKKVFENGVAFTDGETYWFKCEPITWNVLSDENNEYLLVSSRLLDQSIFRNSSEHTQDNLYKDSYVRSWLTNEFYNSAFALNDSYIQTTTVDNSASATISDTNPYASDEKTEDKVFLLSYKDYINTDYGFSSDPSESDINRKRTYTDWGRARGGNIYDGVLSSNYAAYWTRSPNNEQEYWITSISDGGYANRKGNNDYHYGVRPAITIKIA